MQATDIFEEGEWKPSEVSYTVKDGCDRKPFHPRSNNYRLMVSLVKRIATATFNRELTLFNIKRLVCQCGINNLAPELREFLLQEANATAVANGAPTRAQQQAMQEFEQETQQKGVRIYKSTRTYRTLPLR